MDKSKSVRQYGASRRNTRGMTKSSSVQGENASDSVGSPTTLPLDVPSSSGAGVALEVDGQGSGICRELEEDEFDYKDIAKLRDMYLKSSDFHISFLSALTKEAGDEVMFLRGRDYQYHNLCGRMRSSNKNFACGIRWKDTCIEEKNLNTADGIVSEDKILELHGAIIFLGTGGQELLVPKFLEREYNFPIKTGINPYYGSCRACGVGPMLRKSAMDHFKQMHPPNQIQLPCRCPAKVVAGRGHPHHEECLYCVCSMVMGSIEAKLFHIKRCFPCHCGFSGAHSMTALAKHLKDECKQCGACQKTFMSIRSLKQHLEGCFRCIRCKYRAGDFGALTDHRDLCLFLSSSGEGE